MTDTVATIAVEITADPKKFDAALAAAIRRATRATLPPIKLPDVDVPKLPTGGLDRAAAAAALQQERLAQAQNRTAISAQQLATAQQRTIAATSNASAAAARASQTQLRLAAAQERAARSVSGMGAAFSGATGGASKFGSALGGLVSTAGALGIGLGVGALVQFATGAAQAAVSLERTQATLRAVAGSQERYNTVLGIARANQALFGGSLEANLAPLQQFLFISNRSGASLNELNKAAQLLSTINPAEGFEGAGVALSEFFSGDITSLSERFNLPRASLRELAAEGVSAQDKLAGLESLLAQQGITADTLSASLTENARVYNELGAAASEAFTNIGAAAAGAAAPVAAFVAAGLQGFNQLITVGDRVAAIGPQIVASAGSYSDYVAQVDAANAALDSSFTTALQNVPKLTEAQYAYATALSASGVAAEAALQRTSEFGANIGAVMTSAEPAVAALGDRLAALGAQGGGAEEAAFNLALAFNEGGLSAEQLAAQLTFVEGEAAAAAAAQAELAAQTDAAAGAAANQAGILDLTAQAAAAEEQALRAATEAAFEQANAGADLEAQARAAAQALLEAGGAGAGAAAQLAGSSNQVDVLTAAYYRLIAAQQAAGAATAGTGGLGKLRDTVKGAGEATAAIRALARVYNTGPLATKPTAGGGRSGGGRGRSGAGGAASAAAKDAQAQEKQQAQLYERLQGIQERYHDTAADAERTYQERILSITQDFAKRRAEAEQSFADAQVDSRADFYTGLANVDKSQRTAMIQEFEAAQVKAAEIAATQGADAGEKYLSQITEVIRARAQRQADIAAALEAGDKGEAEFLRGVDAIARAAEQRKLDAAASGGEGLAGQERAALEDAAAQRDESLAKAQLQAQQGLIDAEQARADKAKITNEQLQAQLDLVRQIAQAGGVPQGAAPAAATPAAPTAATTPAETPATGAAAATGAGLVLSSAPSVESLLNQAISELRRLRSSPNYAPGA